MYMLQSKSMDFKDPGRKAALPVINSVRLKTFLLNVVFLVAGVVISFLFYPQVVAAFTMGFAIGMLSQWLSFQALTRSISMEPERAGIFIMARFYVRFAIVVGLLILSVWKLGLNPLAVIAGFSGPLCATIFGSLIMTREAWR